MPPTDAAHQDVRFVVLDSWRGICAIFVALYHLQALAHVYDLPLIRHATLFVDFFFVLSGFVITHAYGLRIGSAAEFRSFVVRRLGRLWPLHIAVLMAFVVMELLKLVLASASGLETGRPAFDAEGFRPLSAIPVQIFLLQALGLSDRLTWNFPSWSISAEFWTYILFGLVCLMTPWRKTLAMIAFGALGLAVVACWSHNGIDVTYDLGLFRCVYGFALGHVVYLLHRRASVAPAFAGVFEVICMIAVFTFVWRIDGGVLSLFAPVVFGAAVWIFAAERGPLSSLLKHRLFVTLGTLSYSIYMVHAFVAAQIVNAVLVAQKVTGRPLFAVEHGEATRMIAGIDPYWLDGLFAVFLLLTIGVSILTHRFIEMPGKRLSRQWAGWLVRRGMDAIPLEVKG